MNDLEKKSSESQTGLSVRLSKVASGAIAPRIGGAPDIDKCAEGTVLLLDTSSSMYDTISIHDTTRRIDALRASIREVNLAKTVVLSFNSMVEEIKNIDHLTPSGTTNLHFALDRARAYRPRQCIVVTDGEPTCSEDAIMQAVNALSCPISVIFVGDPENEDAIQICSLIASSSGGQSGVQSLSEVRQLTDRITALLCTSREAICL